MYLHTNIDSAFVETSEQAVPIRPISKEGWKTLRKDLPDRVKTWLDSTKFRANRGEFSVIPSETGTISEVYFGLGYEDGAFNPLQFGALAGALPAGPYTLSTEKLDAKNRELAHLAWAMGAYEFSAYRKKKKSKAHLVFDDQRSVRRQCEAIYFTRDLINIPANDMGPDKLDDAFRNLASTHEASVSSIVGDDLLDQNFPMIHAVGRASSTAPRLLDMVWGDESHPKITLVGKGVTFDTGGLNIKPGNAMALMKKDMGGAANVMGLAHMIMDAKLPIRLRVLVGAVENSISGNAFRPGDILPSRQGMSVEIGNTDAEGRLVLGDCLSLADEEEPVLLIDMATLTGAARVALGPELSPFYTANDQLAGDLTGHAKEQFDPVWRMPLWEPYQDLLSSKVADVNHISSGGFAGSITAALFLSRFVKEARNWMHFDIYGWTPSEKPWAPVGGEAQAIRALFAMLKSKYPAQT